MTEVLLLGYNAPIPDSWLVGQTDNLIIRLDLSQQTYQVEGLNQSEELVSLNEVHFKRRQIIANEIVDDFYNVIKSRPEFDVLSCYRNGMLDALSVRCAVWAILHDLEAAEIPAGATIVLDEHSAILHHGRAWMLSRGNINVINTETSKRVPLASPPVRALRPLGDSPAEALLEIENTVGLPDFLTPMGAVLAMTNLAHGTHSVTLSPVVSKLAEKEPVLLLNTAPRCLPNLPKSANINLLKLNPEDAKALASDTLRVWENGDSNIPIYLRRLLLRVIQLDVPKMIAVDKALAVIAMQGGKDAQLLTTTDSHWLSNFARERAPAHKVLRTTIQNAFLSASARYSVPATDRLLAIDKWSMRFISEEYGISQELMDVVGSVRYEHLPKMRGIAPTGVGSSREFRQRHNLPEDGILVAFAGQPEKHSSGVQKFAEAMNTSFAENNDVSFALRLHPKEMSDVVKRLEKFLDNSNLNAAIDDRSIEDFLMSADIIITEFSNVGLEAGILGKPLLILKLPGGPAIPPLDEFGIGLTVTSYENCCRALQEFIMNGPENANFPDTSKAFASANPNLYYGNTVDAILADIDRSRSLAKNPQV